MSIEFIFGKSGSGKTTFCVEEILRLQEDATVLENIIYIVPEQFSLASEKLLINSSRASSIMQAQILSFGRLAHSVLSEVGGGAKKNLEDIGKNMLLRKVLFDVASELSFYSGASNKQGFVNKLAEIITEFYQYNVNEEKLEGIINAITGNDALKIKMIDLKKIFEKYNYFKSENYITSDEELDFLYDKIDSSQIVKNSIIFIDSFLGFTAQEFRIIEKLFSVSKKVYVTLPIEKEKDLLNENPYSPFTQVIQTYGKLKEIILLGNLEKEKITFLENSKRQENAELIFLHNNFLSNKKILFGESDGSSIQVVNGENIYNEITEIASKIVELTRERDYKYNEIAIVVSSLETYDKSILSIFDKFDIPVFLDKKESIMSNPFPELILSALAIICENWSYESVFRFLKTDLTGIPKDEVDLMENYVLAFGIKRGKWDRAWKYGFEQKYEIFSEEINNLRLKVVNVLLPLTLKVKKSGKLSVEETAKIIFEFLEHIKIEESLSKYIEDLTRRNKIQKASEFKQILGKVVTVFEKAVEILGEEKVSIQEFSKIIQAGFEGSKLGAIPPSLDGVIVGDVKRTKLGEVKALFVMGACEGMLPPKSVEDGLLSHEDKAFLENKHGATLSPFGIKKSLEEQFMIYNILAKPKEYLCLSYFSGGLDGKSSLPSSFVEKVVVMFGLKVFGSGFENEKTRVAVLEYEKLLGNLESCRDGNELTNYYRDVYNYFIEDKKYSKRLKEAAKTLGRSDRENLIVLKDETLKTIYKNKITTSISRLEKYVRCPFSYYMSYNLKAEERKIYEIQSVDVGNLFHDVLDDFSRELKENKLSIREIEDKKAMELVENSIDKTLKKDENNIFENSEQYKYFAKRAKEISKKSIEAIISGFRKGNFELSFSEASFGNYEGSDFKPIEIPLGGGVKMFLEGKIDRVDTLNLDGKQYVKIIDYKSGNKKFSTPEIYYGLQLQLLVYLDAFIKNFKDKFSNIDEVLPAAVLYFRLDNPMFVEGEIDLEFLKNSGGEELEVAIDKHFKMSGIVVDDKIVIENIDGSFEKTSNIIPVGVKTSGEAKKLDFYERPYTSNSSVIKPENFEKLMAFTTEKAKETAEKILTGEISVTPFKFGVQSACTFCKFNCVCKFDKILHNNDYKNLAKITNDEALKNILQKPIDKLI